MNKIMKKTGRYDLIFISIICVVTGALFAARFFITKTDGKTLIITVKNEVYGRYPLNKDRVIKIKSGDKVTNEVVIKDGYASMKEANCPDKLCVHMKHIKNENESIVCMPNEVILTIESD